MKKEVKVPITYGYDWYSVFTIHTNDISFEHIKSIILDEGIDIRKSYYNGLDDFYLWTTDSRIINAIESASDVLSEFDENNDNMDLFYTELT